MFANALLKQHKGIAQFVQTYQHLTSLVYNSPEELKSNPPHYDVYITGSDQLWNPRYCNGDPAFMLHFAPSKALKIAYAASIGINSIDFASRCRKMQFIFTCFVSDETGFDECGFVLRGNIVAREDTQEKPGSPCNNAKNQSKEHKPRPMCHTVERLPINIEHFAHL